MLDMHSHFLFEVDDGPKTIEDTICIVKQAIGEGITDMIATPHAFSPKFHVPKEEVHRQIKLLTVIVEAEEYPIKLHPGQEVRLNEHFIDNLITGEIIGLAGSRYILLELPSQSIPLYTINVINSMIEKGFIPIIAHPERNRAIAEQPEKLEKLIRLGALSQVTSGSLTGHFGKNVQKLALKLIESNLIHTYGSDVHNMDTRPFLYNQGLDYLEKKKHHDTLNILLENNERILKNESFIILEPETPVIKEWWKVIRNW